MIVVLTVVCAEFALRLDPFGILRYLSAQHRIQYDQERKPYRPVPQIKSAEYGTITINENTTRYLPDAHDHACKIAIVGDSMAWGWEVDDHDTWANLLASHVDAELVNWAVPGYNLLQVLETIDQLQSYDGFIYLFFENDGDIDHTAGAVASWSAIVTHLHAQQVQHDIYTLPDEQMRELLTTLPRNIFVFGFSLPYTRRMAAFYPIHIIPFYDSAYHLNSTDWHPNPMGHRLIFEAVYGQISTFINQVCASKTQSRSVYAQ